MNILEIFIHLINKSITAGIVILAVLAVRELLRRIGVPRRYIYLLWIIPALRLLCPVSLSSVVSLFNLPVFDRAVQTETGLEYLPEELSGLAMAGEQTGEEMADIPQGYYGMSQVRQDVGEPANYYGGRVFEVPQQEFRTEDDLRAQARQLGTPAPRDPGRLALQILAGVWLAGMVAILARHLWAYIWIRRKTVCAARIPGGAGDVYECEGIRSPFAMGLLRGRIYIPYHMAEREREYILLHERCHIRHYDLWVRLLACILQAVYWYNPLVWVANRCMERDMEMRCDEYVLGQMGEDIRYDYSRSLLSYATGRSCQLAGTTAFGESGTGKRVKHVLQYKKTGIFIAALAVLAIAVISVVCLTDRSPREGSGEGSGTAEVKKTYFWGEKKLKIELPKNASAPAMLLVGRSVLKLPEEVEEGSYGRAMRCVGEHCYFLVRPLYTEDAVSYELQVFDGDRKEWSSGVLNQELLGQGTLYGMFAVSDQELVYLISTLDADRQYAAYHAVHVNREGEELKRVDLLPVCLEQNMIQQDMLPTNICVDNEGNYYMISFDGKQMVILDSEGGILDSRDCSIRYKGIVPPWMTAGPDGGILTQGYSDAGDLRWMWLEGTREKNLGSVRGDDFLDRMILLDNGIYYYVTTGKKIYQGDEKTGNVEFLFDAGSIIGVNGKVAVNGEGEILLFSQKEDRAVAYVLNRAGETQMGEGGENLAAAGPLYVIDIQAWKGTQEGVEFTLPIFMADHPEYAFELQVVPETTKEERSAVHDRVWNELIAGGGPDIFFIDAEDLPVLWEKGVLMDLRELISQETLDQIYPGLLATGTIDGSLAGVSESYYINTITTSTDIWPEEKWTVEDVVGMLETGEFIHAMSNAGYQYCGGRNLVWTLVCRDIANSPFVDWERGTCSFDSELFLRLLKVAKQYEYDGGVKVEGFDQDRLAAYSQLLEGGLLAVESGTFRLDDYVRIRQRMGEKYNDPGLPGATGSRQVLMPQGYYVVNKNCADKGAAAAYLEFVLSADNIADYRRDCQDMDTRIIRDWEGKWAVGGRSDILSGSSLSYLYLLDQNDPALFDEEMPEIYAEYLRYSKDYYDYMEALEGSPPMDDYIVDIILEEIDNYLRGSQSAEHVADVIQKRVKLYLSERH